MAEVSFSFLGELSL